MSKSRMRRFLVTGRVGRKYESPRQGGRRRCTTHDLCVLKTRRMEHFEQQNSHRLRVRRPLERETESDRPGPASRNELHRRLEYPE